MKPAVFLIALLLSASSFAASYIYRWADDEGQVHYTETPPRDRSFETLRADSAIVTDDSIGAKEESSDDESSDEESTGAEAVPPPPAAKPAPSAIDANRAFLKKAEAANKAEAEAKAKQNAARAQNEAQCKAARERLAFLDVNPPHRLASVDASGEVSRLSEDDYAKRRVDAEKAIAEYCS